MALLDRILELFGTNRTRMQWKVRAWKRAWERRMGSVQNRAHALTYEHQACPACGHPAGSDERTCTRCGEPLGGKVMHRARRALGLMWPADRPVVATLLGAAIVATYAATVLWTRQQGGAVGLSPSSAALVRFGSLVTTAIDDGEWWRLVTSAYLHVHILHIAFNLMSLWTVASYLEEALGKAKTWALYAALGVISSLASYGWYHLHGRPGHSAGASGAICGLIGVAIGFSMRRRNVARHMTSRYVGWAVWIAVIGLSGWRIDNAGHVGGLVPGFLVGLLVRRYKDTGARARRAWSIAALLAIVMTAAAFVLAALTPLAPEDLLADEVPADFSAPAIDPSSPGAVAAVREASEKFELASNAPALDHDYAWSDFHDEDDLYTQLPGELLGRMRRLFGPPAGGRWIVRERASSVTLVVWDQARPGFSGPAGDLARDAARHLARLIDRVPAADFDLIVDSADGPLAIGARGGTSYVRPCEYDEAMKFLRDQITAASADTRPDAEIELIFYWTAYGQQRHRDDRPQIVDAWNDVVRAAQAPPSHAEALRWATAARTTAGQLGVDPAPAQAVLDSR